MARLKTKPARRSQSYFQQLLLKHGAYTAYPFIHEGKEYVAMGRAKTTLVLRNLGPRQTKIASPSVRQDIGEKLLREHRITRRLDFGNK